MIPTEDIIPIVKNTIAASIKCNTHRGWQDDYFLRTGHLATLKGASNEKCTDSTGIIYETSSVSSA